MDVFGLNEFKNWYRSTEMIKNRKSQNLVIKMSYDWQTNGPNKIYTKSLHKKKSTGYLR